MTCSRARWLFPQRWTGTSPTTNSTLHWLNPSGPQAKSLRTELLLPHYVSAKYFLTVFKIVSDIFGAAFCCFYLRGNSQLSKDRECSLNTSQSRSLRNGLFDSKWNSHGVCFHDWFDIRILRMHTWLSLSFVCVQVWKNSASHKAYQNIGRKSHKDWNMGALQCRKKPTEH